MDAASGLDRLIARARVDAASGERLRTYLRLLEKWNGRINLTAGTDWQALGPLFEEAVWAAGLARGTPALHLDVGSGAGFPAVPMAALQPGVRFDLVEARTRRAVFLEVVAGALGLTAVRVCDRTLAEYLRIDAAARGWDRISWKGVRLARADVAGLLERAAPHGEFWLFHARELPVEDPEGWLRHTRLVRRAPFPGKAGWFVSIFTRKAEAGSGEPEMGSRNE